MSDSTGGIGAGAAVAEVVGIAATVDTGDAEGNGAMGSFRGAGPQAVAKIKTANANERNSKLMAARLSRRETRFKIAIEKNDAVCDLY